MIYLIAVLSLLFSVFLPWYGQIALAAGVCSFYEWSYPDIFKLTAGIFILHVLASVGLDFQAGGLISRRFTTLLSLPHFSLFHVLSALLPTLLFFTTALLIFQSRSLMRKKPNQTR